MFDYLKETADGLEASEITGIWLSSDDGAVFDEVCVICRLLKNMTGY